MQVVYEDGHAKKVSITGLGYKWEYSNLKGKKRKKKKKKEALRVRIQDLKTQYGLLKAKCRS